MTIKQVLVAVVLVVALVTCVYGALLYATASLPYPDPTPALLAEQDRQMQSAQVLSLAAGAVAAGCAIWLRRLRKAAK